MTVRRPHVVIVGAGLSGLYAAYALERRGICDCTLLEARARIGGRLVDTAGDAHAAAAGNQPPARVDLGATWFWPALQPQLDALVTELGIGRFAQHDDGDMLLEHPGHTQVLRMPGYVQSPRSMRLRGGMTALCEALHARLRTTRVQTSARVRRIRDVAGDIAIDIETPAGARTIDGVQHVLLALPPRLAEAAITFEPALEPALAQNWRATPTWMAAQAKYVAVYPAPFWRADGLSGFAHSARGPLGEIHDASSADGNAALFGFVAVPARARADLDAEQLKAACRAQLARLFGPRAAEPDFDDLKDWARDPCTAVPSDLDDGARHGAPAQATANSGAWRARLHGIASEWSVPFPGYVAGAVDAAQCAVDALARVHGANADAPA